MARTAIEIGMRIHRFVGLSVGNKSKKRLASGGLALDKTESVFSNFLVHHSALFAIKDLKFCRSSAFPTRHDMGKPNVRVSVRLKAITVWPEGAIRRSRNTDPLVKALIRGKSPLCIAQMPLPKNA